MPRCGEVDKGTPSNTEAETPTTESSGEIPDSCSAKNQRNQGDTRNTGSDMTIRV